MHFHLRAFLAGFLGVSGFALPVPQTRPAAPSPAPGAPAAKPAVRAGLTVEEVCKMAQAGLSEDLLLTLVRKNGKPFSLSAQQVLQLKQAAVSDNVIKLMLDPAADTQAQPATAPAPLMPPELPVASPAPTPAARPAPASAYSPAPGTPEALATSTAPATDTPLPDENGIYWLKDGKELVRIEGKALSNIRTGSVLTHSVTMGIKRMQINAQLRGPRAEIRVREKHPRFYLFLPEDATAGDYLLLRLVQRNDVRQLEVGQSRFFKAQAGVDQSREVDFSVQRLKSRLYLVSPKTAIEPGEYGFYPAAGSSELKKPTGRVYDFGVDPQ